MNPAHEIALINEKVMKIGALPVWTIYDHPADFPDTFIARLHISCKDGIMAAPEALVADLETLRAIMHDAGLTCVCRQEGDPPVIVETWL